MTTIKNHHSEQEKKERIVMVERIGKENIARQFTPADPATMIGYLYPHLFIKKKTPIEIKVHASSNHTYSVETKESNSSNIFLVEKVNLEVFRNKLLELMELPDPNDCSMLCCNNFYRAHHLTADIYRSWKVMTLKLKTLPAFLLSSDPSHILPYSVIYSIRSVQ